MRLWRDPQVILTVLCGAALILSLFRIHPAIPYFAVAFGSYFALERGNKALEDTAEQALPNGETERGRDVS